MEIAGWAGILASLLGLALAAYGVFYNGRANRALMTRQHEDVMTLLQAIQEQVARQHEDAMALLQAMREEARRQHEDAVALLRAMREEAREAERRHQALMERLAELIVAEGERTRRTLGGGAS